MKATQSLVDILSSLDSENRKRAVQAAFVLLGETALPSPKAIEQAEQDGDGTGDLPVSPKARLWMKQNGISGQVLGQVFHLEDGVASFIAGEAPGKSNKEKSINAYILSGLMSFLATGEPKFADQQARKLCTALGCYDTNNHGSYLKAKGNNFAGTKDKGWTLTAPGLKAAAKIIQELTAAGG